MDKLASSFGMNIISAYHLLSSLGWLTVQSLSLSKHATFASWSMPRTEACFEDHLGAVAVNDYPLGTPIVAVAFADFVVLLPLMISATTGLMNREPYGLVCSWLVFAIHIYRTAAIFWQAVMSDGLVATEVLPIAERAIIYVNLVFSVWGAWFQSRYFASSKGAAGYD